MKLTCVIEDRIPGIGEPIMRYANEFSKKHPSIQVVEVGWDDKREPDISAVFRRVEVNGPNGEPIPEAFINNPDTDLLCGSFCPFSDSGMDAFDHLRMIGIMRAGMENIDIEAATQRGIAVVNATGRNADAVSDFTVGMLLSECRNIAKAHHVIKSGGWTHDFPSSSMTPDLRGKTVGIFGFGYIGKLVAEKLSGFHVKVIVYDPYVGDESIKTYGAKRAEKEELFKNADFNCVHARLTKDTEKTIGCAELNAMKPTAYLINTARAGLVDYDALYGMLANHRIAGAALDVFNSEPLNPNDRFVSLDNVTLTTHLAGSTVDAANNSARLIFERMEDVIAGKKVSGFVNPEVLSNERFSKWVAKAKEEFGL